MKYYLWGSKRCLKWENVFLCFDWGLKTADNPLKSQKRYEEWGRG